ncbi:MAG: DUF4159 domain-containing protein [Elusimicrobia bacterium]|nr:DUF4159 domain-containing protein [Elusimicrobiota bacterium]
MIAGSSFRKLDGRNPAYQAIFNSFFNIRKMTQVPKAGIMKRYGTCQEPRTAWSIEVCSDGTVSGDGEPGLYGLFDGRGRLSGVFVHNSDIMDGIEYIDDPQYPLGESVYARQFLINLVTYALSH